MRQRYSALLEDIHKVLDEGTAKHRALGMNIKKEAMRLGLHRDLNLIPYPANPIQPRSWNVWMPSPKR